MTEPFLGEIKMVGFSFNPRGWLNCDGQLLPVSQNSALFSLLGTIYGGDGRTSFGLPDLRGRVPIHVGEGPGLSNRTQGSHGGNETHTLATSEIPAHTHQAKCVSTDGNQAGPVGAVWSDDLGVSSGVYNNAATPDANMSSACIDNSGGGQSHNNMQPFLTVRFIIATVGLFPSRS